jgi:hypothetical protein
MSADLDDLWSDDEERADDQRRDSAGADMLGDVETFLARFVAFPSEAVLVAVVLWVAHTHALDAFESTPRLAFLSPEPGSGKTRALEVIELLVPRPLFSLNASAAALFRRVSDPEGRPTVLLDEADTVFGPRAAKEHEDLRGFVNGGHRRGAMALRCVIRGKEVTVEEYPCYAAVALAGLDDLPDTVMTRSVIARMRRRAPGERVEPFRRREHGAEGERLHQRLVAWAAEHWDQLDGAWPDMPEGVEDRKADVWEALLAVADAAGGEWPERARVAAVALVADSQGGGESLGIRLLRDIRAVFDQTGADNLATETLLQHLVELDEAPWGDMRGKPLDARGLSRRLSRYEVRPRSVRIGERTPKGYNRSDFFDAWSRYVALVSDEVDGWVSQLRPQLPISDREPTPNGARALREKSATSATPQHSCAGPPCQVPGCPASRSNLRSLQ